MKKKIFSMLVLLMTAVTGAWAEDTYNVTFNANGNTKVVENVTLPHTFSCYYNGNKGVGDGELDLIIQELYGFPEGWCDDQSAPWMDNAVSGVTVGISSDNQYFSISTPFEGTAQLKGWYYRGWEDDFVYTLDFTIEAVEPAEPAVTVAPTENKNEWKFTMPDYAVVVNVEYDTELALSEATDNTAALAEWHDYEADVTLTRTLQAGGWNTFCVPFSMAIPSGWTVMELSSSEFSGETLTLYFADAQSIEAGTPYLVKVTDAVANPTFDGVIISETAQPKETTYADFVPVFGPTNLEGGNKNILFITGGDKLTYPAADGNINGFRAYFLLHDVPAAGVRAFAMSFDDDTTSITTVLSGEPTTASGTYDLQGRRIEGQPTQKGVYIVNGKKTIK